VLLYSLAFPFFGNVDENMHFDLVMKYARGDIPLGVQGVSPDTTPFLMQYSSPEFLFTGEHFDDGKIPLPAWRQPEKEARSLPQNSWSHANNFESSQPPLYYILAGLWLRAGEAAGLGGLPLLYWIRILNVFLAISLVRLAFAVSRAVFPQDQFMRFGVPMLVALLPQDAFYSLQNDVLSPLCFGSTFLLLIRWWQQEAPRSCLGILLGLAIAATFLTKVTNRPFAIMALLVLLWKFFTAARSGTAQVQVRPMVAVFLCTAAPVAVWLGWTDYGFGDFTGAADKIHYLGWKEKSFSEMWSHPIFTADGLCTFLSDLFVSFWRGELTWHGKRLAMPSADFLYAISSLVFIIFAIAGIRGLAPKQSGRRELLFSLCVVTIGVASLAFLSIRFDFGQCFYPSRAYPYFTSGRLLIGILIPFALLYVFGIKYAVRRLNSTWLPMSILAGILIFSVGSEILVNRVVFSSEYNWFHR
jgi:hypothetical protein